VGKIEKNNKQESTYSVCSSLSHYEKIIDLLSENNSSLTMAEISRLLKISRNTVAVSLSRLEGAERVVIRKVGMAKLYSLKTELKTKLYIKEQD